MSRTLLCINDLNPSVFCVNGSNLIGIQPGATSHFITDGTTTQQIFGGDTITYQDSSTVDFTVSATDTVTAAVKISAAAGNDITVNADGLYLSKDSLVTGASWNDGTNNLVLTFDSGATVNVPIVDNVASFISDFTVTGNTGTDLVNNHESLAIVGANGLTTAVTGNTVTVDFNCAEPLDVTSLPTC